MSNAIVFTLNSNGTAETPIVRQEFTESTSWTVPYTGRYIAMLYSPLAKGGEGGKHGRCDEDYNTDQYCFGGQGGYGGSADFLDVPMLILIDLKGNQNIEITINNSITSFDNIATISAGSAGQDGTDAQNIYQQVVGRVFDNEEGLYVNHIENWQIGNGSGGLGGSPVIYSIDNERVLFSTPPMKSKWPTELSGKDGSFDVSLSPFLRYHNIADFTDYFYIDNYVFSPRWLNQIGNGGESLVHSVRPSEILVGSTRTQNSQGDYLWKDTVIDFSYDSSGGELSSFQTTSAKPGKIIIYSTGLSL